MSLGPLFIAYSVNSVVHTYILSCGFTRFHSRPSLVRMGLSKYTTRPSPSMSGSVPDQPPCGAVAAAGSPLSDRPGGCFVFTGSFIQAAMFRTQRERVRARARTPT